mmetsp:Transcript_36449/g.60010  ORF Transcript_36449/g.60010 Transcript_36449/m.60010 type:complete len:263 (-) Transcript_36449:13-801(-)
MAMYVCRRSAALSLCRRRASTIRPDAPMRQSSIIVSSAVFTTLTRKFGEESYWEEFYGSKNAKNCFEWFVTYKDIEPHILRHFPPAGRILHLGCGSSDVGARLSKANNGFTILEVDAAKSAIAKSQALHNHINGAEHTSEKIEFYCNKAQKLPFRANCIDAALDKGTVDALICGSKFDDAIAMVGEAHRVLKEGGVFVQITTEGPELRKDFFIEAGQRHKTPYDWESIGFSSVVVDPLVQEEQDALECFLYILQKKKKTPSC